MFTRNAAKTIGIIAGFSIFLAIAAFGLGVISAQAAEPAGKHALIVLPQRDYWDAELLKPYEVLQEAGVMIHFTAPSMAPAVGTGGLRINPDYPLRDIWVEDFDAFVFIGGTGAVTLADNPHARRIAREAYRQGKVVAAICAAGLIPAKAGVLDGKAAAAAPRQSDDLRRSAGRHACGSSVCVDGRVITADGPRAAREFGYAVAGAL